MMRLVCLSYRLESRSAADVTDKDLHMVSNTAKCSLQKLISFQRQD